MLDTEYTQAGNKGRELAVPLLAVQLQPYITDALDAHGITVQRERTSERGTLRLSRTLPSNYPTLPEGTMILQR